MERKIKRGDIYYANLNPVIGSEQGGTRPVLIISNDVGNKHSPTVIVAPITSRMDNTKELSARNCGKRFTQSVWQQELNSHPKSVRIGRTF